MSNKNYWNKRVASNKHTGWADEVIYTFDQAARLNAVSAILKMTAQKKRAFDFGGGTGDFTELLMQCGTEQVDYYDISDAVEKKARIRFENNRQVHFLSDFVPNEKFPVYDLGISITVLDHILVDEELYLTIDTFSRKIKRGGYFIFFEYTRPQANGQGYQRFSSFDFWIKTFFKFGFEIQNSFGFYHPQLNPSTSFTLFQKRARLLKKFKLFRVLKNYLKRYAVALQKKHGDFYWPSRDNDIMSIILFKKI